MTNKLLCGNARRARYASQLITKSLGGALSFASTPQTGSTFSLLLPKS